MRFSILFSLGLSAAMTGLCYLLRVSIIRAFLTEPASFEYVIAFTNIPLTTSFLFGLFYVLTNALQAMGAAVQALIINLSRQGIIYTPVLLEAEGIAAAKARGVRFGRLPRALPENYYSAYRRWKTGSITGTAAAQECGMPLSTFRYRAEIYEKVKLL